MADQLMILPAHVLASADRLKRWKGLYAARVGSGPEGETCGSCQHLERFVYSKYVLKCGLCKSGWTRGAGTDIKARAPACSKWAKRDE